MVPTSGVAGGKSFHMENPLLFLGHFSRAKLMSKSNWYPLTLQPPAPSKGVLGTFSLPTRIP